MAVWIQMTVASENEAGMPAVNRQEQLARMRRRVFLFFAGLCLFLVATFLIITSRFGMSLALDSLNAFLSGIEGAPQIRADVKLDFLDSSINIKNLSLEFKDKGNIFVDKLSARIKPFQLLQNTVIIEQIEADSPVVDFHLADDSATGGELSLPDLPFDIVVEKVLIKKGEINIEDENGDASFLESIHLISTYRKNKYNLQLETGSGQFKRDKVSLPLNFIRAEAWYGDGIFKLSELQLFLQNASLTFSGQVDTSNFEKGKVEINMNLPLNKLSEVVDGLPKFDGTGKLKATISGGSSNPRAKGVLEISAGKVDWLVIGDAKIAFDLNKERLIVDNSEITAAKGKIEIPKFSLRFDDALHSEIELKLDNLELGHLLSNVSFLHSKVMQYQSGIISMKGTIKPLVFNGNADLQVKEHQTYSTGYKNRSEENLVVSTPRGRIRLELFANDKMFEMRNGTAAFGDTVVQVKTVQLGFNEVFHMEFVSGMFHFKDAGKIVGLDIGGQGPLTCTIDVGDDVIIKGSVDAEDLTIERFKLGKVKFDVDLSRDILKFKNIRAEKNKSVYYAGVSFNFNKTPTQMTYDFSTDNMDVKDIVSITGFEEELGDLISGRMVGNATITGHAGNFNGGARLVFPEFSTSKQKFDSAKVEVSLDKNILRINKLAIKNDESEISAKGTIEHFNRMDIKVESEGWQTNQIDFIEPLFKKAQGEFELSGKIKGKLTDPLIEGQAIFGNMKVEKRFFGESELHFELTRKYLDLNGKLFGRQLNYSLVFQFDPVNRLDIKADATDFDYTYFLENLAGVSVDGGTLDMQLDAVVPFSRPKRAKGRAILKNFRTRLSGVTIEPEDDIEISLEKGVFSLSPVTMKSSGVAFESRGEIGFDGRLNAIFKGQADFKIVSSQVEAIEDAQGILGFNLNLSGEWENLVTLGTLEIKRSKLKFAGVDSSFSNVNGTIHIDVDRVNIDDLRLKYGGGDVGIRGFADVKIPEMELKYLDLRLNLNRVGLSLDQGILPLLSGQLTLNGTPWPLNLSGKLNIDELKYVQDIKWQKKLITDKIVNLLKPKKHIVTEEQKPKVNFDVSLYAPDTIMIRNNLARLELTADLKLTGDDLNIGLLNTISTDRGYIYFEQNEFEVIRFMVEFTKPDRIYPRFDILAETTVTYTEDDTEKNVAITLYLNGDEDNLNLKLDSDGGFSHSDIIMLLLVGQPSSVLKGNEGMATGLSALSSISGVDDEIKNRFKLDEFRLVSEYSKSSSSSSSVTIVPRLVIGKEIAENVFITYSTSIAEQNMQNDQRFEIKYKLKHFTISAEWDADSTQQYGNFGADLKYHLDF